ncbi:fructosamine kinase family protein [Actibacterium ureilyticum]|uniref:fructosamine kinase family protein n=1 Tax=Actibacterium ureilyticum TaxID=1590614 RepID=UPI000BAACE4F|nr:fructosamine kinase family protein [Actibacterium ureilyticum]
MAEATCARIAALTGQPVTDLTPLHGGDLSPVLCATLADGTRVVAKTGPLVGVEARMLHSMHAAGCTVPRLIGCDADLLVMDHILEVPASGTGWAALGQNLRRLHARTGDGYGWGDDYAFGPAPIPGGMMTDWPAFWGERRLLAFADALPADIAHRVEGLCARLPDILPHRPPAALLHGDLWTGNVIFTDGGAYLIDPACCHGDPEVDLAMLHLFGTPPAAFHDAYGPLAPGWQDRRPAYALWPALVHLRLFGASYRGLVTGCLSALGA